MSCSEFPPASLHTAARRITLAHLTGILTVASSPASPSLSLHRGQGALTNDDDQYAYDGDVACGFEHSGFAPDARFEPLTELDQQVTYARYRLALNWALFASRANFGGSVTHLWQVRLVSVELAESARSLTPREAHNSDLRGERSPFLRIQQAPHPIPSSPHPLIPSHRL